MTPWLHRWPEGKSEEAGLVATGEWEDSENYAFAVPIVSRDFEEVDLPEEQPGVCYVVSLPALMGLRAAGNDRRDVVAPDTGSGPYGAVRDERGQVIGCRRFVVLGDLPQGYARDRCNPTDAIPAGEWEATLPSEWRDGLATEKGGRDGSR
jgi:hypothetical protein